jgi:hypothetical protein
MRYMSSVISLPLDALPDPKDSRACQAFADALVDGVPTRMLLDTGTYRSYVPHRIVAHAVPDDDANTSGPVLVHVGTVQWGSLIAHDLTVNMNPPDWPHPALLGMDVLGPHSCDFRFSERALEIDGPSRSDAFLTLQTPSNMTPTVPVHWEGASTNAIWDTGAGITIVHRTWAEAHPDIVTITDEFGTGTNITGATGRNPKGRLASCRIGRATFPEQACGVTNSPGLEGIDLIVGLPLISQANWYMDFPERRWTNEPV